MVDRFVSNWQGAGFLVTRCVHADPHAWTWHAAATQQGANGAANRSNWRFLQFWTLLGIVAFVSLLNVYFSGR
jgi:hypothetical protein